MDFAKGGDASGGTRHFLGLQESRLRPHISGMSRVSSRAKSKPVHRWRITYLKASPARDLGRVEASDQEGAVDAAAKQFGIPDTRRNKLLVERAD
jgi:hypothetical protein